MTPQDVVSLKNTKNTRYKRCDINNLIFVLLHTKACFHVDSLAHQESGQASTLEKIMSKKELGNIPNWNIPG